VAEPGVRIIVIVGPTATGKSSLAAHLAARLGGEIIGFDSMQVYRGLDAGTAKPPASVMREIPHHLIDIADPGVDFSAGDFARLAGTAIGEIAARGRSPILAGGTGLYLRALMRGLAEMPRRNARLRSALASMLRTRGEGHLHRMLVLLDPGRARELSPRDTQRVVRALEVAYETGRPQSAWVAGQPFGPDRYPACKVGLTMPWPLLTARIEARVERMFASGLVEEAASLLRAGVPRSANCFKALGYREILPYLSGSAGLVATKTLVKANTRRYARRQLTWFRREPGVVWFELGERPEECYPRIEAEIARQESARESSDGNRHAE